MTLRFSNSTQSIEQAAKLLGAGNLVAFPTETVYGLGADATNAEAVARIFAAKNRPSFNPLIVHFPELEAATEIAEFDSVAISLAQTFWPGALTLVLPLLSTSGIAPLTTAGQSSVAVRVPNHPLTQRLLRQTNRPIAAPSANPSGRISPTTADHVLAGLNGKIAAVLDGGACSVGLESTIVATGDTPRLLRAGGVPAEAIEEVIGQSLGQPLETGQPCAPGQLASHYAPRAKLRLNAKDARHGERFIAFGPHDSPHNLSPTADLTEAAARLFELLHLLDQAGTEDIAVAPIPNRGLGRAINDRLSRAAAPRE